MMYYYLCIDYEVLQAMTGLLKNKVLFHKQWCKRTLAITGNAQVALLPARVEQSNGFSFFKICLENFIISHMKNLELPINPLNP